jgi:hypothetical protein
MPVTQNTKKRHYVTVNVVIGFNRRSLAIKKNSARSSERFTIVVALREQWEQPLKVRELATIPPEHNAASNATPQINDIRFLCRADII